MYAVVHAIPYTKSTIEPMADSTTIRVDRDVHAELKAIAEEEGLTLTDTLRKLVEQHRRDRLFNQANRAYRRLRNDGADWDEVEAERQEIEGTQADGLGDEYA
jgi:predicted DNA-binding ribbon-helix-helix protein